MLHLMKGYSHKTKFKWRKEFLNHLEEIENFPIQKTFLRSSFPEPETKLKSFIATSVIKTTILAEDLMAAVLEKRFFTSLSLIRMIFEEVILITFSLSKLEKATDREASDHILTRISVGKKTKQGREDELEPYNIHTTLEEAEKYIKSKDVSLKGIFEETYIFISEYVHPNAPSRYHFMKRYGDRMRVVNPLTNEDDVGMLLNYSCMALGLYLFSMKKLIKLELKK